MRKTTEEKILDKAQSVVEDIQELYNRDARVVVEYIKLMNHYKKLNNRFYKVIRINDYFSKDTLKNNEKLEELIKYTVKTARENLNDNVKEHKKTKQSLASHILLINNREIELENKLKKSNAQIVKLERELANNNNTNQNLFAKAEVTSTPSLEINLSKFKNFSYQTLLSQELKIAQRNKSKLVIAKLTIDNLSELQKSLDNKAKFNVFLRAFTRYLNISFKKKYFVYYLKDNIYYLILQNLSLEQAEAKIYAAKLKMKIKEINIKISIGATSCFLCNDSFTSINERCDIANYRASISNEAYFRINCIKPTNTHL